MVEVNVSYPDFSGGEVSPDSYGRFDLKMFYKGARRVENFISYSIGMAKFRTGTSYVSQTRLGQVARLERFNLIESVSYILEFTDQKLRFHRNGAQVRYAAQNITGITQANPAVLTYSGADTYANGDSVYIDGVVGMTQVNGREFIVANVNVGANTFELSGINSTGYTVYSSGGTVEEIVEVTTPYLEAEIFQLKVAKETGSIMYITHESYAPRILTYTGATSWALTTHVPVRKSLANSQNITNITQANPAVVTYAGSDTYSNGDIVRISDVVGMVQVNGNDYTVANVNTGANTFELSGIDSTGYSAYSSGGFLQEVVSTAAPFLTSGEYPRAVGFYEQRLIYGGSTNAPQTLYFSKPAEPDDFSLGDEVDDGIEYTIGGDVGRINWLRGTERFLGIGCASDVVQATGGIDGVITPTSISIRPSNAPGCLNIMPIGNGNQIFFMQGNALVLRSFEYDFQRDSYFPVDRNIIADHITKSGISQISYQEGRPNILWGVRNDGILVGMTIEETEGVSGWHRHSSDGIFVSVASESRSTEYERLWVCAEREGTHYIEYFTDKPIFPRREDYITDDEAADYDKYRNLLFEKQKDYIHLDSSLSYYGNTTGVSIINGALTGTDILFTATGSIFTANDVGREIWKKSITGTGTETGRAVIVSYTSATVVNADILEDFDSIAITPTDEWYFTTDSLSGLDHLEGKTVSVCADGGQHTQVVVTNGTVTLDRQCSVVHVGLPYTGYLETNDLEGGGSNGTAQTKRKNVFAVGFRFLDTLYAKFGTSYYKLNQIEMRMANMRMDRPPELFTGDTKEIYANDINDKRDGGWSREKRAIIVQDQPYPCNVQLIVPYMSMSN